MEPIISLNPPPVADIPDIKTVAPGEGEGGSSHTQPHPDNGVDHFRNCVQQISAQVDKLEKHVNEVEHFYSTTPTPTAATKGSSIVIKDKDRHFTSLGIHPQDASQREAAAARRMQELIRQFATILRQASTYSPSFITQHKWAWPFLEPVDVKGLGLHDYYQVIEKPMDFGTIKTRMEAKDGGGYNNVREIYADVRLVFKNAMKYNDEKDDVHVMAKTLLEKFEEKWLQLLPKVAEEEKRREEEEAKAQLDMQLSQEAAYAHMARDARNTVSEVSKTFL
ncbi:Bromodomain containing protein [Parasponia andersonii]|uniref:Bromodomain containing protein n=1 Tax=Parasponia andersonii TaxID=3476 RepID=A0A2P5B749_PARAD|nr:Bromodomain containing protein [Parasponia andersonii]